MAELGGVIGRLAVHLNLETAAFERGTKRAETRMSGLQKNMQRVSGAVKTAFVGMLGAFAVDQIVSAAKESLEYASSLGEVASQIGTTTEALQSYRYVATQTGIAQDEMDKGLARLSKTIGEAAGGNEKAAKLFDRLGISIRDSSGNVKDAGDLLPEIADAYTKLGSAAEQSALSAEVFGSKLGQKLNPMLAEGSKGILAMRDRAHDLGLVLDEAMIQNADEAADKITELNQFIKMKFTATVADNAKAIGTLADELINLITKIGSVREEWRKLSLTMQQIDIWTEPLGSSSWSSRMERSSALGREKDIYGREDSEAYQRGLRAAKRSADAQRMAPAYSGVGVSRKTPFSIAPKTQWPTTRAMGTNAFGGGFGDFAPGQGEGFIRMADAAKQMTGPLQNVLSLTDRINISVGARMVSSFREAASGALDLAGEAQGIMDRLFPVEARRRQYIDELAKLRLEYGGTAAMAGQLADAEKRLRAEWLLSLPAVEGLRAGFGKYMQMANDAAETSEVQSVRIARTFQDMADDVLGSLNSLTSSIKGGGFLNILSSVVGLGLQLGGAGAFGKKIQTNINRVPGFANGTNFAPGGLAMVGERGPELVNLPRGSRVTPNNELGGMTRVEIADTTGLFRFRVNGQIMEAAPSIASAGASGGVSQMRRAGNRRLA